MESWARIYSIGIHPGARRNCMILFPDGVLATHTVRLPPRSPNLNPNLERFMRSVKEECLERMVFFGERSL